jgi:hypothetical protein
MTTEDVNATMLQCVTCAWWRRMRNDRQGSCRRYAPCPAMLCMMPHSTCDSELTWPTTTDRDWCGEWKRRAQ